MSAMFRPFAYISAAFIAGIFIQSIFSFNDISLIAGAVAFFSISLIEYFRDRISASFRFLLLSILFLGSIHLSLEDGFLRDDDIMNLTRQGKIQTSEMSEIFFTVSDPREKYEDRFRIKTELSEIRQNGKRIKAAGTITVFCPTGKPEDHQKPEAGPQPGDLCRIVAKLKPYQHYRNGMEKRYEDYHVRGKEYFSVSVASLNAIQIIRKKETLNLGAFAKFLRVKLIARIDKDFTDTQAGSLIKAVTLGSVDDELTKLRYQFRMGGIFHIVSVSGIHFSILAVSLIFIFKIAGVSLKKRYILTILTLIFFCLMVGAYTSVLRATLMACLYFIARLLSREGDFVNIISLTAFIMLLINPMDLFSPGFQFTFIVSFFIYFSLIRFDTNEKKGLQRKIHQAVIVSAAAFIAALPLNAYHFNQVSLISLLNNILIVPLMFIAMNAALLYFLLIIVGIPLAGLLQPVLTITAESIIRVSSLSYDIPFLSYRIPTPSLILVFLYFALLIVIYKRLNEGLRYRYTAVIFSLILILLVTNPLPRRHPDGASVQMLDVGQGQSIFIETPDGKTILVDGGGSFNYSEFIGERIISKFLWDKGIRKIDVLILTHSHFDHVGGLWPVARNFRIGEFWENGLNPRNDIGYELLLHNLDNNCIRKTVREGFQRRIGDIEFNCLSPSRETPLPLKTRNEDSLVFKITTPHFTFLLTGDAESNIEEELIRKYSGNLRSDILQAGHHGSPKGTSLDFLMNVKPHAVLISSGRDNIFGFPPPGLIQRLHKLGMEIYRTDLQGRISVNSDEKGYWIETE